MTLHQLPDVRETIIVVGTTCRKPLAVLQPYLASLDWQDLPSRVKLVPAFVLDFTPEQADARQYLEEWVIQRKGVMLDAPPSASVDFSDDPRFDAHQWNGSSMARVGESKNKILAYANSIRADYVFFADSDLILDRTTLRSLLEADKPITTAVYWTHWTKRVTENSKVAAGPQVWLTHPYGMSGRGMEEAEFRAKLLDRGLHRVWGFGACTLIGRRALEAGINFSYVPEVSTTGLMGGEDRHFCIRAERSHIDAYADCWPDIFHIYHADQHIPRIPEMLARLGAAHPEKAQLGDLVSLRLRPLEPIPVSPTMMQQAFPQTVRGRLGTIPMVPELEEAIYSLTRGQTTIVQATFPMHHPIAYFRGRKRLIELTLVDVKRFGFAPVIDEELKVGPKSGRWVPEAVA